MTKNRFRAGEGSQPAEARGPGCRQYISSVQKANNAPFPALVSLTRLLARQAAGEAQQEHSEIGPSSDEENANDR